MLLIKLGINKYGSRKLFGCVLQAEGNCMQVRVSVFKWFKTDGLIWGYNDTCGYCLIQINTRKKDPSLVLEAYDLNGEKLFTHVVKASSLQF